jgi:hypothetical protein
MISRAIDRQAPHENANRCQLDHAVKAKRKEHKTSSRHARANRDESFDGHPPNSEPFEPKSLTDERKPIRPRGAGSMEAVRRTLSSTKYTHVRCRLSALKLLRRTLSLLALNGHRKTCCPYLLLAQSRHRGLLNPHSRPTRESCLLAGGCHRAAVF